MVRNHWKPYNPAKHYTELEKGCGNCANSVKYKDDRVVMCGAGWPKEIDNGDGTVTITFTCSGKVITCDKKLVFTRRKK